jgi:aspartyl-tRNA(Asn)/glutamyl-tRNA(Gln) amidotransferase subunit A
MSDLCFLPAVVLAQEIRRKSLSALEVSQAFLQRIAGLNRQVNAYVTICEAEALSEARRADQKRQRNEELGLLHGVPFSVKDLVFTRGTRTTAGSRIHEHYVPVQDAISVSRLREAGAILLGKTNTPEFGYKATTENLLFGPTRNPWNTGRTPGGSSGGAAAATAAGLAPLSLGTDGGGSIRIPASFCGVFGLKPTFGRVPNVPGFRGWKTLSHTGPITRTVSDAAAMLDVMAGHHEMDRNSVPASSSSNLRALERPRRELRIGYSADLGFARVDRAVAGAVEAVLPLMEEMGHKAENVEVDLSPSRDVFETIVLAENTGAHRDDLESSRELMDKGLVKFIENGTGISAAQYFAAIGRRDELAAHLSDYFSKHHLLVTPTVAVAPFPIENPPREIAGTSIDALGWIPFTYPFNLTGNPAASLPCGVTSEGLPVGLQVVGPRYADELVLNFCAQFEAARPWAQNCPRL